MKVLIACEESQRVCAWHLENEVMKHGLVIYTPLIIMYLLTIIIAYDIFI